tara:strand:- start:28396 stop:29235 length:840 start_codon:yes stop_codon:yes gene_type:complete
MTLKLSIIIPCYNSEKTLEKTLESVFTQIYDDWEALIINDGSTDGTEIIALSWVEKDKRFKYFAKPNEGLGKTRNYGIAKSAGKYILPLDSDNLVVKDFAKIAIAILDSNSEIGVVHGHAEYFGNKTGLWKIDEFDMTKILVDNYIDACAVYKKNLWNIVGGYDENMPFQGNEDWDFWIALGIENVRFYHLNQITFKYFVAKNSMIQSFTDKMHQLNNDYIYIKYNNEYQKNYKKLYSMNIKREEEYSQILKSKKFVIDLFCITFFKFSIFGTYKENKE